MKNVVIDLQFNDVVIIKINRPEVLNALDKDVIAELSDAIDVASNNESIKVVIITGTGEDHLVQVVISDMLLILIQ